MNVKKYASLSGVLGSCLVSLAVLAFRDGNYAFSVYFGLAALANSIIAIRMIVTERRN